jgi:superfamily II DNA or RNA helicase
MSYQSLVAMCRQEPEIGPYIRKHFGVIIEDEAHEGIGDKTKNITDAFDEESAIEIYEQELIRLEAESARIVGSASDRYRYKFTATPSLIYKNVHSDDRDFIHFSTVEEGVRSGAIILPQYMSV